MAVACAEERAGDVDGEVQHAADAAQVPAVHVAAGCGVGGDGGQLAFDVGRDADDAEEGVHGHRDAGLEDGAAWSARRGGRQEGVVAEVPDLELGFRELVRQQAESGEEGGPAVVARLELEELDLQHVARLGAFDVHGAEGGVGLREVEVGHRRGFVVRTDLVVSAIV